MYSQVAVHEAWLYFIGLQLPKVPKLTFIGCCRMDRQPDISCKAYRATRTSQTRLLCCLAVGMHNTSDPDQKFECLDVAACRFA